jgi:hypothetical protein
MPIVIVLSNGAKGWPRPSLSRWNNGKRLRWVGSLLFYIIQARILPKIPSRFYKFKVRFLTSNAGGES